MAAVPGAASLFGAIFSLHQDSSAGHVQTMELHTGEYVWCTQEAATVEH